MMQLWSLFLLGALVAQQQGAQGLLGPAYSRVLSRASSLSPRPTALFASSPEDLSKLTVPTLKERLRAAGLPVGGLKAELVARLEAQAPAAEQVAAPKPVQKKVLTEKKSKKVEEVEEEEEEEVEEEKGPRAGSPSAREKVLWTSAEHAADAVEGWWKDLGKALMTVGSKGVTDSHVRSLKDLLGQHQRVRVKFATDKVDALALAEALVGAGPLKGQAELLVVKPRGLMVGRAAGSAAWPSLSAPKARGANSQAVCYGCGEVGHHRVECPNKKRAGFMAVGTHPDAARIEAARAQEEEERSRDKGKEKRKPPGKKATPPPPPPTPSASSTPKKSLVINF